MTSFVSGPQDCTQNSLRFIDTVAGRCYTESSCSSLASPWYLSHGWATSADEAARPTSFANRQTAGPSPARLAFMFSRFGRPLTDLLHGQVDYIIVQTDLVDSDPFSCHKRIANGGSLAAGQWYLGIGSRS